MAAVKPEVEEKEADNVSKRVTILSLDSPIRPRLLIVTSAQESVETGKKYKELTGFLVWLILIVSLGSIQCGFNLWLVHDPKMLMEHVEILTADGPKPSMDESMHPVFVIFLVTSFVLGCLFGSLLFGPLADKCGRKGVLMINNLFSIFSATILAISTYLDIHVSSALAHLLTGICTGIFSCAIPIYLGEIAPTNWRGGICALSVMFVSIGMLMSQLLGAPDLLGSEKERPFLSSIPGIIALFQILLLLPFPESPRYLLIQKRNEEDARQALKKLRNKDDVDNEIKEILLEDEYEIKEKQMTIFKLLCYRHLRWQLFCVITLFGTQQFSGVNTAYYYADRVFLAMKVEECNVRYSSALLTFLSLFIHGLSAYWMDSMGRRPLLLGGFGICIISCIMLALSLELQVLIPWLSYVSSFFLLVFLAGIIIGPNSIPHLMITELFLQSSRASAFAIGGFVQWLLILVAGFIFILLEKQIKTYSFLILLPFSVIGYFYILKFVPETKKMNFLDIRKYMDVSSGEAGRLKETRQTLDTAPNY